MKLKNRKSSRKKKKTIKKKSTIALSCIIEAASKSVTPSKSAKKVITSAFRGAKAAVKKAGRNKRVKVPRILTIS